jgi:hypothetical protein
MSKLKIGLIALACLVLLIGATYGYLGWYKDYAPRMQDARHRVFKQTQAYVDGKITHLNRLKLEYQMASDGHKGILRSTILTEASTVDPAKLPASLRRFIESLE